MEWKTLKSFSILYVSMIAFSLWYYKYNMYIFVSIIDMKNNYSTPNAEVKFRAYNIWCSIYNIIYLVNNSFNAIISWWWWEIFWHLYQQNTIWTSYSLRKHIPIMKLTFLWLFIIILRLNGNTKEWKIDGPIQKEDAKHDFRGIY